MRPLRLLGFSALLASSGCYRYVPFGAATPPPGAGVRLYLTPQGMGELAPRLGAETTTIVARVARGASADPSALSLVVSETGKVSGGTVRWVGEPVIVPLGLVARGERRTLDRRRTLLAGGAASLATVGVFIILRAVGGGGSGEDGGGGGGPVP